MYYKVKNFIFVDTQAHAAFGGNKYLSGFSAKTNYAPLSFSNPSMGSQNGPTLIPSSETIDLKAPPDLHTLVPNLYEAFPHREIFENIDGNKYINSNSTSSSSPEKEAVKIVTTKEFASNAAKPNLFMEHTASSHYDLNKLVLLMGTVNDTTLQDKKLVVPNTNAKRLILNKKNLKDKKDIRRNSEVNDEINKQLYLVQCSDQELVLNKNEGDILKSSAPPPPMIEQNLNEYKDSSFQDINTNEKPELTVFCEQTHQMKNKNVSLFTYTNKEICKEEFMKSDIQAVGETNMKATYQLPKSNVEYDLMNNSPDLCGIKLERSEYYTIPALNEIHKFKNEKGECLVKGFTIGRHGYGRVCFPEEINVSNLDLDAIVEFSFREITVYPDDSQKPPVGQGLNRPAEITLEHVWPRHSVTHEVIKDPKEIDKDDFITRLNLLSEKQNAKLVNYFADTGKWVFSVKHFTKFYFDEDIDKNIALELNKGECEEEPKVNYSKAEPEITTVQNNISCPLLLPSTNKNNRLALLKSALFKDESTSDNDCTKNSNSTSWELSDDLVENSLIISHNYMDMALFKAKSFKIGWGPKCSFFILNIKLDLNSHKEYNISTMEIENQSSNCCMMNLEQHLKAVFEESTITIDKSGIPLFTVNENYNLLIQHQDIASSLNENNMKTASYYAEVWKLCLALWGPNATSPTSRRALFSNWLEECVASYLNNEVNLSATTNIFTYLTGHNIKEAAESAMINEFPQLSLLISQAGTNENFKLLMNHQVKQWHRDGMLNLINKEITKIYVLFGGIESISGINVYDKIEWKRTLAMHLWYATSAGTSLISAIQAYNKNINSLNYINLPIPDYCINSPGQTYDVLYHIMTLFINPTLVLEKVINPNNYTDDPLDYRLSWLLLQIFIALRIGSISEEVANTVHTNFACQLEDLGLWKWSIFVLLFIKDESAKKYAILDVLGRNLKLNVINDFATEDFLVNDLKIPREWIHSTLIIKSDLLEENAQNYKHYIFISDWYKAHEIAVNSLIPELALMGQYEKLLDILQKLIPGKNNIALWHTQVGLILDILKLHKDINIMENVSSQQLLIMKQNVVQLCYRIKHFPLMTLKHSFVISKFSKFITTLLKILYCELPQFILETVPEFAYLIKILHMPPDYKYNELMECVYHHVRQEAFM
ncbi:hypothetical protein ILUMI_09145 [Ignelater luminosus]|uniref:Nuclear pore complex protein Nup98-Nup96 n=1 Tax=Ignelater luminosus TaxID=2038154 RepID=A0A8K0GET4_IGNLU|nr:hypothetical protein ILUMI_09145 [Ignelater luminosus]